MRRMHLAVVTPTHDPKYLPEIWQCLERQTLEHRWDWVIAPTRGALELTSAARNHEGSFWRSPRVHVVPYPGLPGNIGAAKLWAFSRAIDLVGRRDDKNLVLVELDHDDLLAPTALEKIRDAFAADPELGFAYSDCVDWSPTGELVTYHHPERRQAWAEEGWRFGQYRTHLFQEQIPVYPLSWEPSAKAMAEILYAPNHVRAWRASTYLEVGGHDPARKVCDDLDLVQRTYLKAKCARIPEPLYLYRVDGRNTWLGRVDEIQAASKALMSERLHALVEREMQLRGLPLLDLGGGIDPAPPPWIPIDLRQEGVDQTTPVEVDDWKPGDVVYADLARHPWPFKDSSIGAFRAFDLLEHLPDRLGTMREIYRCLASGGWLLSRTPSAAGPGAYQDPTHASLWVRESFGYYTERRLGRYLPTRHPLGRDAGKVENPRFMEGWAEEDRSAEVPYVRADLVSLKGDDGSLPGRRRI